MTLSQPLQSPLLLSGTYEKKMSSLVDPMKLKMQVIVTIHHYYVELDVAVKIQDACDSYPGKKGYTSNHEDYDVVDMELFLETYIEDQEEIKLLICQTIGPSCGSDNG